MCTYQMLLSESWDGWRFWGVFNAVLKGVLKITLYHLVIIWSTTECVCSNTSGSEKQADFRSPVLGGIHALLGDIYSLLGNIHSLLSSTHALTSTSLSWSSEPYTLQEPACFNFLNQLAIHYPVINNIIKKGILDFFKISIFKKKTI